ncbi:HxlR family transcriptional regulator [Streptomyces sp. AcH 505]|uniref:winged helix-turn-helix transcriptional regulator n=1 Tax=Streptomyces sp. AcH 505 TaxID=352211 RepID=UPI00059205EB|nr:HxlR family transcriptional regulator [Streptomyces sp. AcH 505]
MPTKTAAARRDEARRAYDAFLKECPTHQLLGAISDKWVSLIVTALGESEGAMRYSDLGRRIPGVSQKMLTQSLRSLERDGLVTREVTPSVPVRVDYELTPLGRSLRGLLSAIKDWAETHFEQVDEARSRYDEDDVTAGAGAGVGAA